MPPVGTVFIICIDGVKDAIMGVVNNSTSAYFNMLQCITDGLDSSHPIITGNQIGVTSGLLDVASYPKGTFTPATEWVLSNDVLVNTPAWPDLTKKYIFKQVPGILVGSFTA